jgi:hypothetical protein
METIKTLPTRCRISNVTAGGTYTYHWALRTMRTKRKSHALSIKE